nr:unnamed protein product [Digitaria exilis]
MLTSAHGGGSGGRGHRPIIPGSLGYYYGQTHGRGKRVAALLLRPLCLVPVQVYCLMSFLCML